MAPDLLTLLYAVVLGYLCGSVPFGLLLTRAAGLGDIRAIGSGNIGATNVLRTGNRWLAAATLVLDAAKGVAGDAWSAVRLAGHRPLAWSGPEESLAEVCTHLVVDKVPWLASIDGDDEPTRTALEDITTLIEMHAEIAPRWLALTRDIDRRAAWSDRIVDALCDPPETFVLSQIWAHTLTFSAHRRQIARWMLADAGIDVTPIDPDPIMWHRLQSGGSV